MSIASGAGKRKPRYSRREAPKVSTVLLSLRNERYQTIFYGLQQRRCRRSSPTVGVKYKFVAIVPPSGQLILSPMISQLRETVVPGPVPQQTSAEWPHPRTGEMSTITWPSAARARRNHIKHTVRQADQGSCPSLGCLAAETSFKRHLWLGSKSFPCSSVPGNQTPPCRYRIFCSSTS